MRRRALLVLVCGCKAVGPDYKKPETETKLAAEFNLPEDPALETGEADLEKWWEVFQDPQLTSLIDRAAKQNLDVRIAVARVNESRARVGIARAAGSPQVGLGGGAGGGVVGGAAGGAYGVGIDASWELDVWGKIKRQVEAATAEFEVTVEEQRDVSITLYSEAARNYLAVRTFQERLESAQRNIDAQKEIVGITRERFEAGLSSRLDVAQAERILATSQSRVPPLRIQLVRATNTIGVLLGQFPKDLHEELKGKKPIPVPPEQVAVGVPANLVLAAQYESWSIPWSVILAIPMGVLGAFIFTIARGYTNNVYTQVGLVLLIGLVCKNSILIVEFAKEKRDSGSSVVEAALEAARLRFRPILMTALSFVLGTLPLVVATGAGAGSRKALGTAVFGGMVVATVLGVLLTPALYRMIQGLADKLAGTPEGGSGE